ncbi:hypothetical protein GCM10023168_33770 [Fodinibacter luteus]|uniref:Uncharacterized protein n=1 Tax=Fodinibacter luteus TaxID=552064 RepID=A0ABP8KNY3_9MICO
MPGRARWLAHPIAAQLGMPSPNAAVQAAAVAAGMPAGADSIDNLVVLGHARKWLRQRRLGWGGYESG